jgi:uncharacterized membrane protein YkvA (DUF1232 family)
MSTLHVRLIGTASLGAIGAGVLARLQGSLSLGDALAVGLAASLLTSVAASFFRNPGQFLTALYERVRYALLVPLAFLTVLLLFAFRIFLLLFKLSLKLLIWLVVSAAYLFLPIDVIPDFIIGLGQIDDIIVFISLGAWAFSAGVKEEIRTALALRRPQTPFP